MTSAALKILDTKAVSTGVVVILVASLAIYLVKRYGAAVAEKVGEAVNPLDANNLANRAVTGVGAVLSGDPSWSLGGWLYEWSHKDEFDGKTWSTTLKRYTQVTRRSDGKLFNVSADGTMTPAN
jgi:hypothetical protein